LHGLGVLGITLKLRERMKIEKLERSENYKIGKIA
jgi:hypothetical protein